MTISGAGRRLVDRYLAVYVFLFLAVLTSASPLLANDMLVGNSDRIHEILLLNLPVAAEQLDRLGSDVARVYHQRVFDARGRIYIETENVIWWVRKGEAEDLTTFVRDFAPDVKILAVKAFTVRSGGLSREQALMAKRVNLDPSRIKIQNGDGKQRYTNLVVAFETAQPGDLIGISIQKQVGHPLNWVDWLLANETPVAHCELRVKNGPKQAYLVFGNRIRTGTLKQEVVEKGNGNTRDIRIWIRGVDPISYEPYSPRRALQSPSLSLVWEAALVQWGSRSFWYKYDSWNMIAVSMAGSERAYLERTKNTKKLAIELAGDLQGTELLERLYNYVRDEFMFLHSGYFGTNDDNSTVDDLLETRSGAANEKAYLLVAMLRSVGVGAEVVWVHDPDEGGFFPHYPNWGQVSVPMVRTVIDGKTAWCDFGCTVCPVGQPRDRFIGESFMTYNRGADKADARVIRKIVEKAMAKNQVPMEAYKRKLREVDWHQLDRIPVLADCGPAVVVENFTLSAGTDGGYTGLVTVSATGASTVRARALVENDAGNAAQLWFQRRFERGEVTETVSASQPGAETLAVELSVDLEPVPGPMGDTWILPPDLVYGSPVVSEWTEPRHTPFCIYHDLQTQWEFRIPLPPDWSNAEVPRDKILSVRCLDYAARYAIEDGHFVVRRSLKEVEGTVSDVPSLEFLGRHANAIREWELTPIVLTRTP